MAKPFMYDGQLCNIGTSIGVAVSPPGEPLETGLFINADLALYDAKKAGRGRVHFFNVALKEEACRRKASFDALLEGFKQGEIICHYQPQFDAQTLALTGLEALVRWDSEKFGLILPDDFLDIASELGVLAEFDAMVLKQALGDMKIWEAQGFNIPRLSFNVSSHRLKDEHLGERLADLNLPRGKISFELLESAYLDSGDDVIVANLSLLGELGIEIEIDDFGSGHASIVNLLHLAPRRLKIDRRLVGPVVSSQRKRDLVATIVDIGRLLDVAVIAEGVETAQHVRIMQEIGCRELQGYGLAKPMDRDGILTLLRQIASTGGRLPYTDE